MQKRPKYKTKMREKSQVEREQLVKSEELCP